MKAWLTNNVLIGEAHTFDHISNLLASILMDKNTKYLGGLDIALRFNNSVAANEFLTKKWMEGLV